MAGNTPATPTLRTVGSGKDHANVTTWAAAVGNPETDDTIEIGEFHPGADFTDSDVVLGSWTTTPFQNVLMRPVPGAEWSGIDGEPGKVRFKPSSGTFAIQNAFTTNNEMEIHGIEFDATAPGFTGSTVRGIVSLRGITLNISRCSIHGNPVGPGLDMRMNGGTPRIINCALANNGTDGYRDTGSTSRSVRVISSIIYNNGGFGMGRSSGSQQDQAFNTAFFNNASGSIQFPENNNGGWCIFDDQPITDAGFNWFEIIENATLVAGDFVDIANGNYKLQAGSQLIKKGSQVFGASALGNVFHFREDGTGALIDVSSALSTDQLDIGLQQFSYPIVAATPAPIPPPPSFKPNTLTPLLHNNSFIDWAESAGYTIITDGKENMKLFDPFEQRTITLDHRAPNGQPVVTLVSVGSPSLNGKFFYAFNLVNRSLKDEIGTPIVQVTDAAEPSSQGVNLDFSTLTRRWAEATHIAVYRSQDATNLDASPFPILARIAEIDLSTSPLDFTDIVPDADLDFANRALNIAKGPPPIAPFIEELKSVVFATGVESLRGTNASVTLGSPTVNIPSSLLDPIHVGSEISFGSDERAYFIIDLQVASPDDIITLGDEFGEEVNYEGSTGTKDWFLCADPTAVRFSEPERPYDWPPINVFQVGRGHGRNSMMGAIRSNLIVTKREETYAYGFNKFAGLGQDFQISSRIGCVSNRTFSVDENGTGRWLAVNGIAESNGERVRIISLPIADKFRDIVFDGDKGDLAPRAVAVHDVNNHEYICAIPTVLADNDVGCREMIVYNYHTGVWAIYVLEVEITALSLARDEDGYPVVLMGDENGYVWRWGVGDTDGAGLAGNPGTVKGTVDVYNVSPEVFLQDNDAAFFRGTGSPNLGLRGAPVRIIAGLGAGQIQVVDRQEFSPQRLIFPARFTTALDSTSVYQIGTISADFRSGWIDFGTSRVKYLEFLDLHYYVQDDLSNWFLELFIDQPGVDNPVIATFKGDESDVRFAFSTDGSDEKLADGNTTSNKIGLIRFEMGNIPFHSLQWRIRSPYAAAPGTFFTVNPILRAGDD